MISSHRLETTRRWRFRPSLSASLAVLVGLAVLLALGTWQMQRLEWKQGLIAQRTAALAAPPVVLPSMSEDWPAHEFRRLEATGVFRHDLEQQFGVRKHAERLGHHVLTPLVRSDGSTVLVDRGWVPVDRAAPETRHPGQVSGQVRVEGIGRYREDDAPLWVTPENRPEERRWFWYDLEGLRAATGLELLPVVIEADASPNPGGLPVGGLTRTELVNNHLQYALTWYALALSLLAVYIAFSMQRRDEPR
jgi:surfeit locus 1 family protein